MDLKTYRDGRKLTLAEFAKRVGVSEVSMSRYERGARIPRPEIMRKIVEVTDGIVTTDSFYRAA